MDRERSCAIIKIVFEICACLCLVLAVTCLCGKLFDLPIVVLISFLIISVTAMLVRQDRQILHAEMDESMQN